MRTSPNTLQEAADFVLAVVPNAATNILRWFRNNHRAHGAMRIKGLPLPPTPCDTRWSTNYKMVEYFNLHWGQLADICATILRPGDPVHRDLENTQIRRGSEDLAVQLGPIASKLAATQSDSFTLAECTTAWLAMLQAFPKQQFKSNFAKVTERANLALQDPMFLAAYLFHHTYNGDSLDRGRVSSATCFAREHAWSELPSPTSWHRTAPSPRLSSSSP